MKLTQLMNVSFLDENTEYITKNIIKVSEKSTTQSVKRPASVCTENISEVEDSNSDLPISSPSKKFKSSTIGLPVNILLLNRLIYVLFSR